MIAPFYEHIQKAFSKHSKHLEVTHGAQLLGDKKGMLPYLGEILWESPPRDHFYAYLFKLPSGKTIGYIRIAKYLAGEPEVKEFADLIKMFSRRSDGLIIDQTNNPGGDVFYMYALASYLTKQPLLVPKERVIITQEDVYTAFNIVDELNEASGEEEKETGIETPSVETETISGYPVTPNILEGLKNYFQYLIDQWDQGKTLTDPTYLYGLDYIQPHSAAYKKPLLILANQLSVSCGDLFPAIMQDNNRGKVMGSQTAGAGGFVLTHSYPNRFGVMAYSFTGSIAERLNKKPIENLGITPDIPYEVTEVDLQHGFSDFAEAICSEIDAMVPAPPKKNPFNPNRDTSSD